jgi:hypothetical protein
MRRLEPLISLFVGSFTEKSEGMEGGEYCLGHRADRLVNQHRSAQRS